jgi:hypothetical protein
MGKRSAPTAGKRTVPSGPTGGPHAGQRAAPGERAGKRAFAERAARIGQVVLLLIYK